MFVKLILSSVALSILLNIGFYISLNSQVKRLNSLIAKSVAESSQPVPISSEDELKKELSSIKSELLLIRADVRNGSTVLGTDSTNDIASLIAQLESDTPSAVSSASAVTKVTIKDSQFKLVNVLMDKSYSAKVVANIEYGKNYGFSRKENGWYLVNLPSGSSGWVNVQYLKEVNNAL